MKTLLLVLVVGLRAATPAFAQDLSTIAGTAAIVVVDDLGRKTQGRLVRFTPDALTLLVKGTEVTVERGNVASVATRGDSIWSGMAIGALSGTALGAAVLLSSGTQDDYEQFGAAVLAIMGLGVGTAIDALITGRHVVYERVAEPRDFSTMAAGRTVIVVDDREQQTRGRVVRLTPDELTVRVNGTSQSFATSRVARVFLAGDSLKNGALIGLVTGAVIGAAAGTQSTCGDFWTGVRPCSGSEKAGQALAAGAVFGGLGAALGAGIDAMIPGRTLVYQRTQHTSGATTSLMPTIGPSGAGLTMRVSW